MTIFRATFIWTAGRQCLSSPVDGWFKIIARQAIFKIIARQPFFHPFYCKNPDMQTLNPVLFLSLPIANSWSRGHFYASLGRFGLFSGLFMSMGANFFDKKYARANFFASCCMSVSITTIITTDLLTLWSGEYTFSNRQIEAFWVFANCWWIYEVNFFLPFSTFVSVLFPVILLL